MTVTTDDGLLQHAAAFAAEIADVLDRSVCPDPPIRAQVYDDRVLVASANEDGRVVPMPVTVRGIHRLDLRVRLWCTWDHTGRYLAIDDSQFAINLVDVKEPLLRVEYERPIQAAHLHVHAESAALAHLLTVAEVTAKLPKVQVLHLPVGGPRFRPCLEDVVEFAVVELGADAREGWGDAVSEGRDRWRLIQLKAAIRDRLRAEPRSAANLHQLVDDIAAGLAVDVQRTEDP